LKILHVNKFLYRRGGAEGYMLDLARLQQGAGHEVDFFAMQHPDNESATFESLFPDRVELDPPPSRLTDRVRVGAGMVWSRGAKKAMERVVASFRPDVVHLHNVYHQLSPSVLRVLRTHDIPAVMTLHDYKLVCPTYQFLDHGQICEACLGRRFHHAVTHRCNGDSAVASAMVAGELGLHTLTRAYSPVDVFVCPSRFLLGKMEAGKVFPDRLRHLPHFAMLDDVHPADHEGAGVVFAGRLSEEKGVDVAIDAIALRPDCELTICGDGPARASLEARANEKAPGRVRFTGRLDTEALHDIIRKAAVVVVPSRWYENQPMIVLEAFACGRPVIASNLGGLPELIRAGIDGALVAPNDPDGLAQAIGAITSDSAEAAAMGARGRARAITEFSVQSHMDGLASMYELAARRKKEGQR
jgi:glycosyltransferase involved in cell wall biosynthesis